MKEEINEKSESKKETPKKEEASVKKVENKNTGNSAGIWMAIAIVCIIILLIIGGYFAFSAIAKSDFVKNLFKKELATTLPTVPVTVPTPVETTETTGLPTTNTTGTTGTTDTTGSNTGNDETGDVGDDGTTGDTTDDTDDDTATETEECNPDSQFDSDVTIPDGTSITFSTDFTKTWRVKNDGNCAWADGTKLVRVSGTDFCSHDSYSVAPTAAGTTTDLSIDCTAPASAGTYKSTWQLKSSEGILFGNQFSLKIVVPLKIVPLMPPPLVLHLIPYIEQVKSSMVSVPANGGYKSVAATCPNDSIVVGGGFSVGIKAFVYNQSKDGNGWHVYAKNTSDEPKALLAFASCLHNYSNGSSTQKTTQAHAAVNGIGHASINCPAGTIVTGGGYASNPDRLRVYNSTMTGNNGWQVYVQNKGANEELFNVYATCLTAQGSSTAKVKQFSVNAGIWNYQPAVCPSGTLTTSGGFAMSNGLSMYGSYMDSTNKTKWWGFAVNDSASSQVINAYASCLTLQ